MKRVVDIVVAILLAPLVLPVVAIAALCIRMESLGPAFFVQQRVGRNGKCFQLIKLRTMFRNTGDVPSHEVSESQITRIGSHLRRLKIDELPQLWCVLRGDMSLVGPRPCLPTQISLIQERELRGVNVLRPGITGIAQLAGVDMSQPEKLAELDAVYIDRGGVFFDFSLIAKTALGAGRGDAAM